MRSDRRNVRGSRLHPAIETLEGLAPKFFAKEIVVDRAVDALEHAIRTRAARAWAPWWVGPMLIVRGALQPLVEARASGHPLVRAALDLARPSSEQALHQHDILGTSRNVDRTNGDGRPKRRATLLS